VALASFFDYANLHNYIGGRNPGTSGWGDNGYGSITWNMDLATNAWPGKLIMTTKTGYLNDLAIAQSVPENISGRYLPRLLLEQWGHGIKRTYLYQLVDLGNEKKFSDNSFGLLHADFTPKAGYNAIRSLLTLLSDPGSAFQPRALTYSLSGDMASVHHMLLEKRDGTFFLALWVEQPSYDVNDKKLLPVAIHKVTIQIEDQLILRAYHIYEDGVMRNSAIGRQQKASLNVDDKLTILELSN
jgi:hypothetical protein